MEIDKDDDMIQTPKIVYEALGNVAPTCQIDLVEEDSRVKIRFTTGRMITEEPSFEPPVSTFNYELMFDFVDGVIAEDDDKVCDVAEKIYDYELSVKHQDRTRDPLSKGESNVEHCLFSDRISFSNLAAEIGCKEVVLLNPSKGTMKRFEQRQLCVPEVIMLPKTDLQHRRNVKMMCEEFEWKYTECDTDQLDKNHFYYLSFSGGIGKRLGLKYYVGFEPNPIQLALRGSIQEMTRGTRYDTYTYYRYVEERSFRYYWGKCGYNIYPSDYLHHRYERKREFRYNEPLMHDLLSTVDLYKERGPIIRASIVPYNCKFLVGDYSHDKKGIFDSTGKYVISAGNRAWSNRLNHSLFKRYDDSGTGFVHANYAICMFGSIIVFLGKKRFLKKGDADLVSYVRAVKNNEDIRRANIPRYIRNIDFDKIVTYKDSMYYDITNPYDADVIVVQKAGGNYKCGDATYCEVEYQELPSDITQAYGSETYCTTTYQTIVGTKYLYIRQEDDDIMDGIEETTELL
jgi:hypothetical protein